jgi:hypothetical protein
LDGAPLCITESDDSRTIAANVQMRKLTLEKKRYIKGRQLVVPEPEP